MKLDMKKREDHQSSQVQHMTQLTQPMEIFVIEDNPADIRLVMEAFREQPTRSRLTFARDGIHALEVLRPSSGVRKDQLPDLIILDLNLPGKSGFEILSVIKSHKDLRHMPVVVLSSSHNSEDIKKAYDLHANCYVTKPVDLDPFISLMRSIEHFWVHVAKVPKPQKV